jgi:hypothetical protein
MGQKRRLTIRRVTYGLWVMPTLVSTQGDVPVPKAFTMEMGMMTANCK